jgi:uncharacterized membrane protein
MTNQVQNDADEKETGRIEAFSDGVIAIAITLLAFDLRAPAEASIQTYGGLLPALANDWPSYLAFLAGFATIGVMWLNHHRMFTAIRRSDDGLLILNGLLLMAITLVPFVTKLVGTYLQTPQASMAVVAYAGWNVILAIFFNLLWRYAAYNSHLFSKHTDLDLVAFITKQYAFGPLLYVIALVAGLFSPLLGVLICMGLAVFFALPNKQSQLIKKPAP